MNGSTSDLILFVHIPKSAGTTVHQFLNMQLGSQRVFALNWQGNPDSLRNYADLPPDAKHRLRAITGHFQFGLHEHLGRSSTYITMLRNPVDRLVSLYYYALAYPDMYLHSAAATMSLDEFVKSKLSAALDNLQVRLLVGKMAAPIGSLTVADVEQAKNNLRTHFAVVGVQDHVNGFLWEVCRRFGFPHLRVPSQNKTPKRPQLESVAAATKDAIKERNALDLEIYDFAKGHVSPLTRWQQFRQRLGSWAHSSVAYFPSGLRS